MTHLILKKRWFFLKQSLSGGVIAYQTGDQVNVGGYDACRLRVATAGVSMPVVVPGSNDQQRNSRVNRLPHETRESEKIAKQGGGHGPQ